jgi:hypothetical protein
MVNRYCSLQEVSDYLDLSLNDTDYPKRSLVEDWITASEDDIDSYTQKTFDLGTETEVLSPQVTSNTFFLKRTPIVSITSISYNSNGDTFAPTWTALSASDYVIEDANSGLIRTKEYFFGTKQLQIIYTGGNSVSEIPLLIREICLAMVKKRYFESIIGISSLDTELVSISSIRVVEKSADGLKFAIKSLDTEIKEKLRKLSSNRSSRIFSIGVY